MFSQCIYATPWEGMMSCRPVKLLLRNRFCAMHIQSKPEVSPLDCWFDGRPHIAMRQLSEIESAQI
jgi:hypothetical protein